MSSMEMSGTPRTPRPFRSHRTLHSTAADAVLTLAALGFGLFAVYAIVRFAWAPSMHIAIQLAGGSGAPVFTDSYLGARYDVIAPAMPPIGIIPAIATAAICAIIIAVSAALPGQRTPLRYWINANALVLAASALYAFFNGSVGYDAAPFMTLVMRTGLLTLIAAPVFLTVVSMVLPLSFFERFGMIAGCLAAELGVCIVRVAAFALLLEHFGSIPEANLYFFAGPLLDVAYFIAAYSVAASCASARLSRAQRVWKWL